MLGGPRSTGYSSNGQQQAELTRRLPWQKKLDKARTMTRLRSSPRRLLPVLLLALTLAGCSTMPVQEVSDARQAIGSARNAGGERYTPETLQEAERLVTRALRDLSEGDYRAARSAALSAKQQAIIAREAALSVQGVQ
jgi:hypothetical protein